MRNPFTVVFKGVGNVVGSIFGAPVDFLSGRSCSAVCGPTWDVVCYIENFCIEHLLKFIFVCLLSYLVLLFMYALYRIKVFHCFFKTTFKMTWACLSRTFSFWENGCTMLCGMLHTVHERRQMYKRDLEMANMNNKRYEEDEDDEDEDEDTEASVSYHRERYWKRRRSWPGIHKNNLLRRSLKARSHRVHVGVDSVRSMKRKHIKHDDVRVIRTSNFAKKGPRYRRSKHSHRNT